MLIPISQKIMLPIVSTYDFSLTSGQILSLIRDVYPDAELNSQCTRNTMKVRIDETVYKVGVIRDGILIKGLNDVLASVPEISTSVNPAVIERLNDGILIVLSEARVQALFKATMNAVLPIVMSELQQVFPGCEAVIVSGPRLRFRHGDTTYRAGLNSRGIFVVKDTKDATFRLDDVLGGFISEEDSVRIAMKHLGENVGFLGFIKPTEDPFKKGVMAVFEKGGTYYKLYKNSDLFGLQRYREYKSIIIKTRKLDFYLEINYPGIYVDKPEETHRIFVQNRKAGKVKPLQEIWR